MGGGVGKKGGLKGFSITGKGGSFLLCADAVNLMLYLLIFPGVMQAKFPVSTNSSFYSCVLDCQAFEQG